MFDKDDLMRVPPEKISLHALMAECEAQSFKTSFRSNGIGVVPERRKQTGDRKQGKGQDPEPERAAMQFRWAEILPPPWGPEPVNDIYPDGREVELRNTW